MDDMVSRKAVIDAVHTATYGFICGAEDGDEMTEADKLVLSINKAVCGAVKALPTTQPETAKRIVGKSRDGMTLWYQCDMCNEPVDAQDNFCRGCGRRLIDG